MEESASRTGLSNNRLKEVRHLLIYRFGQIGDTVAALPSLWLLRDSFKNADFTLLSEIPQGGNQLPPERVLPAKGLVQNFMKYRGGSSAGALLGLVRTVLALRLKRIDTVAYLAPSIRSPRQQRRDALFFRLAGIRSSLGFQGFPENPHPKLPDGRLAVVPSEADALLHRLSLSGLPVVPPGEGRMDLLITPEEKESVRKWWANQKVSALPPKRWFAVCSGSKWTSKQWPLDRYIEVGRRLINDLGLLPVVMGGSEDRATGAQMISAWGGGLCAAGDLSVRESAALLQDAAFYLGNDTGAMHLAAAVGTPCIAIFSALDWPGRWSPYGKGHHVFRVDVPCAGCLLEVCSQHHECLTGTSVDDVHQACLNVPLHP